MVFYVVNRRAGVAGSGAAKVTEELLSVQFYSRGVRVKEGEMQVAKGDDGPP
jgi:hypothetical protein